MKVALSAILAMVVGLSLVSMDAEAQAAKKKTAAKKAVKKQKTSAAALPAKKVEAAPAPVAAAPVAAPAQTSTASTQQAVTAAAPKKWGVLIDIWAEGQVNGMNRSNAGGTNGSEAMTNSIQIRPSYKITDTASVAAGIDLEHTFGSVNGEDEGQFTAHDAFLQVAQSKLTVAGPLTVKGYFRPYLPTSEASQDPESGRYAALRAGLTAAIPVTSAIELSYNIEPRYFLQKNMSYVNDEGRWTATENYRMKHWLGLSLDGGKFSAYQNIGLRSRYFHQDTDGQTGQTLFTSQQDNFYWETGVGYQIIDNFALNAGYYTEANDIRNPDFVVFDDTKYLYFVEGVVTF